MSIEFWIYLGLNLALAGVLGWGIYEIIMLAKEKRREAKTKKIMRDAYIKEGLDVPNVWKEKNLKGVAKGG